MSARRLAWLAVFLMAITSLWAIRPGYTYEPLLPAGFARFDPPASPGVSIVIDRSNNRLWLRRNGEAVFEALCSAGSGAVLREESARREWMFDTPRGRFEVLMKIENPVWKKPDWAFLELGVPVPPDPRERFEYGVMGEYALYFGDGYLIHGTLYERLLGRSVTHGCIRLGREDLRRVFESVDIGTPIYIF